MLKIRNEHKIFGRGELEFVNIGKNENGQLLSFIRSLGEEKWLIIHNMTEHEIKLQLPAFAEKSVNVFDGARPENIHPYGFIWMKIQ